MTFIIDTNVLLRYPKILEEKENIAITIRCIEELDQLKKNENPEIAHNARRASNYIFKHKEKIIFINETKKDLSVDNEILFFAKKKGFGIITNDLNMIIKSQAENISYFIYNNNTPSYTGIYYYYVNFNSVGSNTIVDEMLETKNPVMPLKENQFLIIKNEETKEPFATLRYRNNKIEILNNSQPIMNNWTIHKKIFPRNPEQSCLFDLLFDPEIKILLAQGPFGSGKAQPNNTKIPTPNGYKLLGELQVGDFIYDRQGNPTRILNVFPQGYLDNYKVTFSDGRVSYCNDEHIWSCYTSKNNLKNFTVKEMLTHGIKSNKTGAYSYQIPCTSAIHYPYKNYQLDPYLIGVLLGDGCCLEKGLTISSQDEEIIQKCANLLQASVYKQSASNYSWTFKLNEGYYNSSNCFVTTCRTDTILKGIKGIQDYSYNKYIDEQYKYGSIEQRYKLLQGLLDTDGTIDRKGRVKFTTTSLRLAKDVQELVWSLGMRATIGEDRRQDKYTTGVCYNVQIMCNNQNKTNLFSLERKKNLALSIPYSKFSRTNRLTIRSIDKMPSQEEMTCLYVDNIEHLYITEDYIVTHNSICLANYALQELQKEKINKIIWVPNNSFNHDSREVGTLPGNLFEKELPFLGSLIDIIGEQSAISMLSAGTLEIVPISIMRGRNFYNSIILVNEAQNLTEEHIKLLLGRCAEGTRIFFDGDIKQTDNHLFKEKSGLKLLLNLADSPDFSKIFGFVTLNTIERSFTARASDFLDEIY